MNYDICSLGSALVDVTFQIDDNFSNVLLNKGIQKGGMTLIEKEDQNNLIEGLTDEGKSSQKACGGSSTNSIVQLLFSAQIVLWAVLWQMMIMENFILKT